MSILNVVLIFILIINSTPQNIYNFEINEEDFEECENAGSEGEATIEECTAVTPNFKGLEGYESKCCIITYKKDPFAQYKAMFGENWKQRYMELFYLNEKQVEDKINRAYVSAPEGSMCYDLIKNYKNIELYGISLDKFGGKLRYNCGDGEETFDREKYNPSDEEEKMNKDFIDCRVQFEENNCLNETSKLFSDNSQCCWCDEVTVFDNNPNTGVSTSNCLGFPVKEFRNKLEEIANKKKEEKYTMKCTCLDKKGKKIISYLDSFNGKIKIKN